LIVIGSIFIVFVGLIVSLDVGIKLFSGVRVEITNRDSIAIQHVSVEVTGASYQIGDIPSGSSKSVKVRPRGESTVTIKYSDNSDKKHQVYIDTYIENGYSGYIKVQIKDGKILHVEQDIQTLPFP
jgi:LEA14-like dessication related protein